MDLTVYGGSSAGCCSLPIMHKGDGALEVVLPCLNVPMEWSSFKSFSTLKTSALVMNDKGSLWVERVLAYHMLERISNMLVFSGGNVPIFLATPSC